MDESAVKKLEEENSAKPSFFLAVGWDRSVHIWVDERDDRETITLQRSLPKLQENGIPKESHADDIMSCCFDQRNNLIFTGGHDGTILGWHFETGFIKHYLHNQDDTCQGEDYIKESKSVDSLLIMKKRNILVSGTAD